MSENDMIAEYVKDRFPYLLDTTDFALYKLSCACRNFVDELIKPFKNINFIKVAKQLDNSEESENIDK